MIAFRLSLVLAAIVIAWAIVRPAGADVPLPRPNPFNVSACTDLDEARAFNRTLPAHIRVVSMSGIEADAFIAAFNEVPPETTYRGDTVFALSMGQSDVYLAFFEGQCLTMSGAVMKRDLFFQTLARAQASIS